MTAVSDVKLFGNQSDFAHFMGVTPQRVQIWKRDSKVAFTDDGKVDFERSRDLVENLSGSPERLGVFSGERARVREKTDILNHAKAKIEFDTYTKTLIVAAEYQAELASAAVQIRTRMENMPYSLAPRLAAANGDEDQCRALLSEWVEAHLTDLAAAFAALAASTKKGRP